MMVEDGYVRNGSGRRGTHPRPAVALPDTVQGVIASRIDLLSPAEKRAIQDAAVVGRVFWDGALEALGTPASRCASTPWSKRGFVQERDGSAIEGDRELIFNHVLTRDVAYESIPRARRRSRTDGARVGRTRDRGPRRGVRRDPRAPRRGRRRPPRVARYAMLAGHRSDGSSPRRRPSPGTAGPAPPSSSRRRTRPP